MLKKGWEVNSQAVQPRADIRHTWPAPSCHVHADNQQINKHILTASPPTYRKVSFVSRVLCYSGVAGESGQPEPNLLGLETWGWCSKRHSNWQGSGTRSGLADDVSIWWRHQENMKVQKVIPILHSHMHIKYWTKLWELVPTRIIWLLPTSRHRIINAKYFECSYLENLY